MELQELNTKIDALSEQVRALTELAQRDAAERENRAELWRDLSPIAGDAMRLVTRELEDVQAEADIRVVVRVVKKLLRHLPDIESALDQIDSVTGLLEVAGPIGTDAFAKVTASLDALERAGYMTFARGGARIVDKIVTSFSEDDVRQLGDNVVLILRTVQQMTQPEVMNFLRATVSLAESETEAPVDVSYRGLLAQMRDPNVRRGLGLAMRVLGGIGGNAAGAAHNN